MVRPLRPYLVTLGVLWVLPAVLVGVLYLVLPHANAGGQCEGIGFGCTTNPADTALLLGILASPWLFAAGLVGCATIAVVRGVRARREADRAADAPAGAAHRG
ncbi:hypothetical protein [Phycicoccus avicenniae]|uniref:hypothetical protein n=1 Tax=Phycicoccus avicenniae TaxID=2828860 RepID=UPI003D2A2599